MTTHRNLVRELKRVRKGRGVHAAGIDEKIGPTLRAACGITRSDGALTARQKLITRLTELVEQLPDDLQLATRAAFALTPETRLPLYQDRVLAVAAEVDRDARTVRRRVDEAVDQLAELAATTTRRDTGGWHLAELTVSVTLDNGPAEVVERHRLVVDADHVDEVEFTALFAVPRRDVRLLHGGTLQDHGVVTHDRPGFTLVPAEPLPRGETFEFTVRYQLDRDALPPELLHVPERPCEQFDLRVRFGTDHKPQVQRFDGAYRRDPAGLPFPVDRAGEVHLRFRRLLPGLIYGVRWENVPRRGAYHSAPAGSPAMFHAHDAVGVMRQ
ncbi:hypothetical protein [Nocardia sp. NRRL S-836]|uniref:hypothetical protein n=1 Tax=Nocardia sp. NRRL S-836 TaxID=1519492 RepID=UPI0006AF80F2|nr:hypothetical protein [Nocardia sp. NRRL S-836]